MKTKELNYDEMKKGDVIDVKKVEKLTNTKRDTSAFSLATMGLCKHIEQELSIRDKPASVVLRKGCICVLRDEDAEQHEKGQVIAGFRRSQRHLAKYQEIDVNCLSPKTREVHQRDGEIMSKMLQGALSAAEAPRLLAISHVRRTPGLPTKGTESNGTE